MSITFKDYGEEKIEGGEIGTPFMDILDECKQLHQNVVDNMGYGPNVLLNTETSKHAKDMTDVLKWQHARYVKAIDAAQYFLKALMEGRK